MTKKQPKENIENTNVEKPIEEKESPKVASPRKRSLFKPFLFFAIFVLIVEAAVLYPYLTEKNPNLSDISTPPPSLNIQEISDFESQKTANIPEEECPPCEACVQLPCLSASSSKNSDSKLIASLKDQIHNLEMENLSLKEKNNDFKAISNSWIALLVNINSGKAFEKQLSELLVRDKGNPFILEINNQLKNYAKKGIPTKEEIKRLFGLHFENALDSFYASPDSSSYWDKLAAFSGSLVRVYPQNLTKQNASGVTWLYLARQQIDEDNFAGALDSISHLPNKSSIFFNDFVKSAKIRILADEIINSYLKRKEK